MKAYIFINGIRTIDLGDADVFNHFSIKDTPTLTAGHNYFDVELLMNCMQQPNVLATRIGGLGFSVKVNFNRRVQLDSII